MRGGARAKDGICAWSCRSPTPTRRPYAAPSRAVRRQRGGRWSLTVVTAEDRLGGAATPRAGQHVLPRPAVVRLVGAGGPGARRDLLGIGIEAGRGLAAGPDLSGRRLGARRRQPAERRAHTHGRGLRGRGPGAGGRQLRGATAQARLLSRVPPLQRLHRPAARHGGRGGGPPAPAGGDRARRRSSTSARWPPPRSRTWSSTSPRCSATGPRSRTAAPTPRPSTTCRTRSRRRKDEAAVVAGPTPGCYRIVRAAGTEVPVSILIPFRDEPRLLRTCVDSIAATTGSHANVELVLIDNGSSDPETLTLLERLAESPDVRVLADPAAIQLGRAQQRRGGRWPRVRSCCSSTTTSRRAGAGGCRRCAPKRSGPTSPQREPASCTRTAACSTAASSSG